MKVGFTGTRRGMTTEQARAFRLLIGQLNPEEFHHGDCVGADDEAANVVRELRRSACVIVCHPPTDETHRAFNQWHGEILPPKTHFARNRDIVDACEVLIAAPCEMEHQSRGGTWYTHDHAKKKGMLVYVVWPDGTVSDQNA